jgi:ABC-type dipeptide/oligopeptide/nickel transport system permease component/ABC-type transport system substrate-binding protein
MAGAFRRAGGGRSMRRSRLVTVVCFLAAAVGVAGLLLGMAWVMRPDMSSEPPAYPPEELRAAERARDTRIDPNRPLVLYRHVDYSQRERGAWWPKGESPVLAALVREGKLPPVAERVGSEPAVVEGVEGIGRYGGTWVRAGNADSDVFGVADSRMSYATLVRWSPQGYPIVPHVARSYVVSPDYTAFTFHLRKGMRWSDGHPFTADDILYWWQYEAKDELLSGAVPNILKVAGLPGSVEKVDDHCVRITFPKPNGLFLPKIATAEGTGLVSCPAHYLKPYHPTAGDQQLIEQTMRARRLASKLAVYRTIRGSSNPEHPRLWPWVYHTHKANPPYSFVRNPYYWMVDTQGNQLPYVDRVHYQVKSGGMISVSAANGQITMQARHLGYDQYTLLMTERAKSGYDVRHWYAGDRSVFVISPNLNLKVDPARPETARKAALLAHPKFRQALSLAINRRDIIDAEFNGQTAPAQVAPGPLSFYYEPSLYHSYTDYDPDRANRMLDELGLTHRDYEGYRTFPDGSRMLFYLNLSQSGLTPLGPGQFVVDDWGKVGVRVILRIRARTLFYTEKAALRHDFNVWSGNGEYLPLLEPRYVLPVRGESNYAIGYANWYSRGGLYGEERSKMRGAVEPPEDHPIRRAMELYEHVYASGDPNQQRETFREALKIAAENLWTINVCTSPPVVAVVQNGFRNVPKDVVASWDFQTPGNAGIETFFFQDNRDTPGTIEQIQQEIVTVTPPPDAPAAVAKVQARSTWLGGMIRYLFAGIAIALVLMAAVKHPYIGRRLLIMIPTLLIISVVVFTIIQLPPGDYVTSRIMQLQESGDTAQLKEIEDLKELFYLEDASGRRIPMPVRYARWLGLTWFASAEVTDEPPYLRVRSDLRLDSAFPFVHGDPRREGLLQGNLGRSMENSRPVNQIVGDRIVLTVLISLGTILFTWAVAIPTGIFSAVRQYSLWDYVLTFVGFIGMCVPSFLLALILMYLGKRWFGWELSELFSAQYAAQAEWDWPKFLDLLKHVWVPVVVLGVGGTAGMIRVMRGNLLDELKKPYVVTARAKGVRPMRLLLKYPVRLALNPFISGIGGLFPQLVSGGAIVAMVLSLPTVGPLMLQALMNEDMYLAGSMLMVLSLLGVFGTLVSDLMLLWLDPRIRYERGGR